ncbi:hypothetical protein ALQ05_200204 [Pseudomonas amygdali pv. mori]|uniref:Uncharacterized protein n=2 Tax=Pseudomonas amygdali pv. mori TaxID=34065 RepID=A0A3M4KZC7_PSEA0|nr:hypothetical protein ALQ05_200204 [Pseudomonas amygdali pv. mori]
MTPAPCSASTAQPAFCPCALRGSHDRLQPANVHTDGSHPDHSSWHGQRCNPTMPLIQIEQDDPKLIAQVHAQIEKMVERVRKMPNTVIVTVAEEFVLGYLWKPE